MNTMALSTDYAIRTGAFDPVQLAKDKNMTASEPLSEEELQQKALERYQTAKVFSLFVFLLLFKSVSGSQNILTDL